MLRIFSEISGLNIVIDPAVQGTVDVALRDVPWDQALDIILRANKLDYALDGTIVRIAPLSVFVDEEVDRRRIADERQKVADSRRWRRPAGADQDPELRQGRGAAGAADKGALSPQAARCRSTRGPTR